MVEAAAGRHVCGVLDVSPPPRLTTSASREAPMKSMLDRLGEISDRTIYMIGCGAIWIYAMDHWPIGTRIFVCACVAIFAMWYIWRFFIRPFRSALKGECNDGTGN